MTAVEKLNQAKLYLDLVGTTAKDKLLTDYITDAGYFIQSVTGLSTVPTALEGAQVDIAIANYSKRGAEGEAHHSEGGVTAIYESLSPALQALLRSHTLARVVKMSS